MITGYSERLRTRIESAESHLCIGIDPRWEGIDGDYEKFLTRYVEETAEFAACFKPNIAYFEALGSEGYAMLERLVKRIPDEIPIILDAKRGDIGSTQDYYAKAYFERMDVAAVTLNAFMGFDAIEPFLNYEGRGVYLLAVTSNEGAKDVEMQETANARFVFELISDMRARAQDAVLPGEVGFVVGLTNASTDVLDKVDDGPLLVPGFGAQGGELKTLAGSNREAPVVVNVSRGIMFGEEGKSFAELAGGCAREIEAVLG